MTPTWETEYETQWTADITYVNGHRVSVCLDDESHLVDRSMHYWDIDDRTVDGWAGSIAAAKREAIRAARDLPPLEGT